MPTSAVPNAAREGEVPSSSQETVAVAPPAKDVAATGSVTYRKMTVIGDGSVHMQGVFSYVDGCKGRGGKGSDDESRGEHRCFS